MKKKKKWIAFIFSVLFLLFLLFLKDDSRIRVKDTIGVVNKELFEPNCQIIPKRKVFKKENFRPEISELVNFRNFFEQNLEITTTTMCKRKKKKIKSMKDKLLKKRVRIFQDELNLYCFDKERANNCDSYCQMTNNINDADIIVTGINPPAKFIERKNELITTSNLKKKIKFGVISEEALFHYPTIKDYFVAPLIQQVSSQADYVIHHFPFSDVQAHLFPPEHYLEMFKKDGNFEVFNYLTFEENLRTNIKKKNKEFLIANVISNCNEDINAPFSGNFRTKYIIELQKHIKIHNYGKCEKFTNRVELDKNYKQTNPNKKQNFEEREREIYIPKINMYKEYKFCLVFENTISYNYFSEKLYHCLFSLYTIPIYFGVANVYDFFKHVPEVFRKKMFIYANDFVDPKELATYLHFLNDNEEEYLKYFDWRKDLKDESSIISFPKEFIGILNNEKSKSWICRLCNYHLKLQN